MRVVVGNFSRTAMFVWTLPDYLYALPFMWSVLSDSNLEIRLIKYETDGNLVNGLPCDFVASQCDIAIKFCISTKDKKCVARMEAKISQDNDVVDFVGDNANSDFKNPIIFPASYLTKGDETFIDVTTYDLDDVGNFLEINSGLELIDKFHFQLNVTEPNTTKLYFVEGFANQKPTKLALSYRLICDEHFYGYACDDYCNNSAPFVCYQTINDSLYQICVDSSIGYHNCRFECLDECDHTIMFKVETNESGVKIFLTDYWYLVVLGVLIIFIVVASPCILYYVGKRGTVFVVTKE